MHELNDLYFISEKWQTTNLVDLFDCYGYTVLLQLFSGIVLLLLYHLLKLKSQSSVISWT
jgi:hypothetical protein